MARAGWDVLVLEKHSIPGGRARQMKVDGFTFDMGPSWYWMPDVFERYFAGFGKNVADYYTLERLDPSYRIYQKDSIMDIPADYGRLKEIFERLEPGSALRLDEFMKEAAYKYKVGINKLVFKPGLSYREFLDWDLAKGLFRLDVFTSVRKHVHKFFQHPQLRQLLEFPVLFLGALPQDTPALYSLMNYADIKLGTWYPKGGMYSIVDAMYRLALDLGVKFHFDTNVTDIQVADHTAKTVTAIRYDNTPQAEKLVVEADVVIGSADYHFIEKQLLSPVYQTYTDAYWEKRVMAPGCLIYYVGLNKKLKHLTHHTLFFDVPFDQHGAEIYTTPDWPTEPLFYVSAPSVSDTTVAPEGGENLFFLIPVAAGLTDDSEALRDKYFDIIAQRFEQRIGQTIRDAVVVKKSFANSDFVSAYNSFKGNAYGLANILWQTAVLKPSCRSKKVKNLFFTGQLTVPGPGVPPSLISGEVVAGQVLKYFGQKNKTEL